MTYTREYLKNLLKENGISETANNKMALMMLAFKNNLISKETIFCSKYEGARPVERPGLLYTRKDIKKLLEKNGIDKTAENKMALMMLALENNLISKDAVFGSKYNGVRPVERFVGRPRIHEIKEKKPTENKYERLGLIRNNSLGLRMTHVETGEVIEYGSTYEAKKKTGHSWNYFENRDGGVYNGYKFEIFKAPRVPKSESVNQVLNI